MSRKIKHQLTRMQKCQPPNMSGYCPDPGSNQGPLDLQSKALPTELSRPADQNIMHTFTKTTTLHNIPESI